MGFPPLSSARLLGPAFVLVAGAAGATWWYLDQRDRESEVLAAFEFLHRNVYEALAETDEQRLYEALARSFHGRELERQYREFHAGLLHRRDEQVEVQLDRLEFLGLDVALSGSDRAEVTASWEVGGRLRHRGHVHLRLLRHRARSTLQFVPPEGWRLVACEVLQGQDFTLSEAERERGTAPPVAATVAPEPRPGP
ncbi:MAG: hypothetical protein A2284_02740 [Deltaproteobacteria bacterium RIFOXYA12_FULL_61_11]|nr:MAG: hypothetical protein A2284_02740 [Deltaproteobacteria bacterium RIFOXYA12_FULL_61_11]